MAVVEVGGGRGRGAEEDGEEDGGVVGKGESDAKSFLGPLVGLVLLAAAPPPPALDPAAACFACTCVEGRCHRVSNTHTKKSTSNTKKSHSLTHFTHWLIHNSPFLCLYPSCSSASWNKRKIIIPNFLLVLETVSVNCTKRAAFQNQV